MATDTATPGALDLAAPNAESVVRAARFVAQSWIDDILADDGLRRTGMSHPVAMVLAVLDGETNPVMCGLSFERFAGFRAALATPTAEPAAVTEEPSRG